MHPESKRINILGLDAGNYEALKYLTLSNTEGGLTHEEIIRIFEMCKALWFHSGDMKQPHVGTTGDRCSNGFVDALRVLIYPNISKIFARDLHQKIIKVFPGGVDWVIGSDHAAATFSFSIACLYPGARHEFTEKSQDGKGQLWKRFVIEQNELVLQIEETITEFTTVKRVRDGMKSGNPYPVGFVPVVGAVVHRSNFYEFEGSPVVYLVHFDIDTWSRDECPLCKAGSERIDNPKLHWDKLIV